MTNKNDRDVKEIVNGLDKESKIKIRYVNDNKYFEMLDTYNSILNKYLEYNSQSVVDTRVLDAITNVLESLGERIKHYGE